MATQPDWIVRTVTVLTPGHRYRYVVRGKNLSARDEIDRLFSWSLTAESLANPRYDLTCAEWRSLTGDVDALAERDRILAMRAAAAAVI